MITRPSLLRPVACLVSVLQLGTLTGHALDLTPIPSVRVGNEDPPTPVIQFVDGKRTIDFRPPNGWQPSGGGQSVTFSSPSTSRALMKLALIKKAAPQSPDLAAVKEDLQAQALAFIPTGAEKLQLLRTVPSPFTVGSKPCTEFVFTYASFGLATTTSISLVDFSETERLAVILSADDRNFDQVREQGMASMFSWSTKE